MRAHCRLLILVGLLCGCGAKPVPRLEKTLTVPKVACLQNSIEDTHWAVGGDDGSIRIWDASGADQPSPQPLSGNIRALAWQGDRLAYSSALSPVVHLWDIISKQELAAWAAGDLGLESTRIEHHALIWVDSETGKQTDVSTAYVGGREAGQVNYLQWLKPNCLLVNDFRGVLSCWDTERHTRLSHINPPRARGRYGFDKVDVTRDGSQVATAQYGGGGVEVFQLADGRSLFRESSMTNVQALQFSPDGSLLACATGSKVQLLSCAAGVVAAEWDCAARAVHFSADGKYLSAAGNRSFVWDVATQKPLLQLGACQDLAWLGVRPEVVALYDYGTQIYSLPDGKSFEVQGDFYRVRCANDGHRIWLAKRDEIQIWSLP